MVYSSNVNKHPERASVDSVEKKAVYPFLRKLNHHPDFHLHMAVESSGLASALLGRSTNAYKG